ncbi:BTAD domain-containing putative transcriptional regulator [Pseudonocardia hydrocarbonoxydans]|uniref:SARP family transcriptional regulator n=1 Tax=Pseudonocardia hydrocarbonoxydans TaxID=76726 RepID=A0A4Y3WKE0_9PSEU|nr:hypothetical protein PHY01_09940 [Pseudonocardia hydrocarbonoxydans]
MAFTGLTASVHNRPEVRPGTESWAIIGPVGGSATSFGVLGALQVRCDGAPVSLPSGRRRVLLAALLVRANRPVTADALVQAAWGDALPADPRSALHTALSRLRAVVGAGALRAEPAGYVLETDALDAARFETLRARAGEAPAEHAAVLLEEALALWRGPAYTEFADRDFATAEAARLDELRLTTVEDRAQLSLELGRPAEAVVGLEALLTGHPLRERARGLLMTALYRAGRPTDALERYRDYRRLLADDLGLDPSPALRDLEARILGHDLPAPAIRHRRAPAPPRWLVTGTAFVGRDDEVAILVDVAEQHDLVTVTGPGGVGKSRLLAEVLPVLGDRVGLPVTVVELAAVAPGDVDAAVAAALGVDAGTDLQREAVLEYLGVAAVVLVLDNCEHVLDECRTLVVALHRRCAGVRVVATSRHRLGHAHEQVLPLDPLPVPVWGTPARTAELTAAVRLFADRARRVRPSFAVTGDSLPAVAEICRRLDGLPLALELAATRTATLGLEPVRDRLGASLDLLGEDGRDRHGSLRAVVEWSFGLLESDERLLLSVLSVFDGDFDLDAAEQVAAPCVVAPVATGMARLVEASLVSAHDVTGATRFRLLEVVRAFASERLHEAGAAREARLAHLQWALLLAEGAARDLTGPAGEAALARLDGNRASLAAAVRWALRSSHPEYAGRITGHLALCLHWSPDARLYDLIRDVARDPLVRRTRAAALALGAGAFAAVERGELDLGENLATEALRHAAQPEESFLAMLALGISDLYRGRHDAAQAWYRSVLAIEGLPPAYRADVHATLALLAGYAADLSTARDHAAHSRAGAEATGAVNTRAFAAYATGETLLLEDAEAAVPVLAAAIARAGRGAAHVSAVARIALLSALTRLDRHSEALDLAGPLLHDELRTGSWPQLWTTLRILAELLVALDRDDTAALLLAAACAAPAAPALRGDDVERYRALEAGIGGRLGPAVVGRIRALAPLLPRVEVVDRALRALDEVITTAGHRADTG